MQGIKMNIINNKKSCSVCKELKDISYFGSDKKSSIGLRSNCRDCVNKLRREAYKKDPTYNLQYSRKYRKNNLDKVKDRYKHWLIRNQDYHKIWNRNKRKNPVVRLNVNIGNSIRQSLSSKKNYKNRHWEEFIGFNIFELRNHLENLFLEGMTWDNYGEWHVDHIIPISSFLIENIDSIEFTECWNLNNLQPLWAIDNIKKGNKLKYKIA